MPEINHKTPAPTGATVSQSTVAPLPAGAVASAPVPATEATVKEVAQAIVDKGVTTTALEAEIERVLEERRNKRVAATKPQEPDWAKLNEQDAMRPDVYIPVIEHDIPDYMNIKLADQEYDPVWANRDQRRLGALLAEGYELIEEKHLAKNFKIPLKFNSEGHYVYADVIALRVHKRILYGKRRRALEISQKQLKRKGMSDSIKAQLVRAIEADPSLEHAFQRQGLGFFDPDEVSI